MSFESAERRESDSRAADPGALWRWIRAAARALIRIALCALVLLPGNAAAEIAPDAGLESRSIELPELIVTVIDPLDARLGFMYHRELDAILAALNNVGFW